MRERGLSTGALVGIVIGVGIIVIALVGGWILISSPTTQASIKDISSNPSKYLNQEVTVIGQLTATTLANGSAGFLQDEQNPQYFLYLGFENQMPFENVEFGRYKVTGRVTTIQVLGSEYAKLIVSKMEKI